MLHFAASTLVVTLAIQSKVTPKGVFKTLQFFLLISEGEKMKAKLQSKSNQIRIKCSKIVAGYKPRSIDKDYIHKPKGYVHREI